MSTVDQIVCTYGCYTASPEHGFKRRGLRRYVTFVSQNRFQRFGSLFLIDGG